MLTICFFAAQYLPTVGGVERYTCNLARQVAARGHRAFVVTSQLPGLPVQETDPHGVKILRVPSWLLMKGRFPVLKPGPALGRILQPLWDAKPDLLVVNTRFYPLSLYAAAQGRLRGISTIVVDHSTGHLPMGSALLNAAGACYEHLAAAFLRLCKPQFYGVSQGVCRWLTHFGIQPTGTLYNAVDPQAIQRIAKDPNAVDWRARLGLPVRCRLVVFVGRMIAEKGVEELAQAFVKAQLQNCVLLIAGDGPLREHLIAQQLPGVYCLGSVPHDQVLQLLSQADLYCLPTYYAEGFPTTFLEAAACGCPIVTTRTGGSDELLPSEDYGLQLDSPDPTLWANALCRCLNDDAWRTRASQNTLTRLEHHFTWDTVADALLALAEQQA